MQLNPYYRSFVLAWETDPDDQRRFRGLLLIGLAVVLVFGLVLPQIELPKGAHNLQEVPPQLAKLMQEEKPKPPPPKPVEKPKPKAEPVPVPKPVDTRKKMENSAAMKAIKDELADLRDQVDTNALRNRKLDAAVGADARSERSLITSKVGSGSVGIANASTSRGFGSGVGLALGSYRHRGQFPPRQRCRRQPRHAHRQQQQGGAQPGGDRAGLRPQQGRNLRALHAGVARARRPAGQDGAGADHLAGRRRHRLPPVSAASSTIPSSSARSWRA